MISLASLVLLAVAVSGFQLNVIETARRLGLYSYLTALEETNSADLVADTGKKLAVGIAILACLHSYGKVAGF